MSVRGPEASGAGVTGLVLAAGAATRFGSPKQLATREGRPLLEHSLAALAAAPLDRRLVVLGAEADRIRAQVDLHGCEVVVCEDWAEGQARSLACGVAAADGAEAVLVLLGDQPGVTAEAIERVLAARGAPALAVRATYGGAPGHPVLLERPLLGRVRELQGDVGARVLLEGRGELVREVACDDVGSGRDIDTAEDLREAE